MSDERKKKCPAGAPLWMVTFGDMMSILVCFFVLIISFSSMDQRRFYDMVGSLKDAFGTSKETLLRGVIEIDGVPFLKEAYRLVPVPIPMVTMPTEAWSTAECDVEGQGLPSEFEASPDARADREVDFDLVARALGESDAEPADAAAAAARRAVADIVVGDMDAGTAGGADRFTGAGGPLTGEPDPIDQGLTGLGRGPGDRRSDRGRFDADRAEAAALAALAEAAERRGDGRRFGAEIDTEHGTDAVGRGGAAADGAGAARGGHAGDQSPGPAREPFEDRGLTDRNDLRQDEVVKLLNAVLAPELEQAVLSVEERAGQIKITFPASATFPSGSADLADLIRPVVDKVGQVLALTDGRIAVLGHTDDVPISTARFPSNWELSAARAISVLRQLETSPLIEPSRLFVMGFADTQPVAPNNTSDNRAQNRRVEIVLQQG